MLEIKYKSIMYVIPIIAPFSKPFFFNFLVPIELPISILIPVKVIITGFIVSSDKFVYVRSIENTISDITVNKNAITIPLIILNMGVLLSKVSIFIWTFLSLFKSKSIIVFYLVLLY